MTVIKKLPHFRLVVPRTVVPGDIVRCYNWSASLAIVISVILNDGGRQTKITYMASSLHIYTLYHFINDTVAVLDSEQSEPVKGNKVG